MKVVAPVLVCLAVAVGLEARASAQTCVESSPGVASIQTNGITSTIMVGTGSIPKVNMINCGFAATRIDVTGIAGKDYVILQNVPASIPVSLALGAGTNNVTVYTTNGNDTVACGPTTVDRDADGTDDLDFGTTTMGMLMVYGKDGDDVIDCSNASYKLKIYGGNGNDTIDGGPLVDILDGGAGNDLIHGHAGNDYLYGNTGNDQVYGDDGNDIFNTKSTFDGNDAYYGGPGNDVLSYSTRTTAVIAGGPTSEDDIRDDVETVKGGKVNDTLDFSTSLVARNLYGGTGNDTLRGGAGADKLYGEAGNDTIVPGGVKDPVINGGDGDDTIGPTADGFAETIACGTGIDTYVANGEDVFKDCETANVGFVDPPDPTPADPTYDDLAADDTDAGAGGCASSRPSPSSAALVLVALVALRRRRRDR